MCEESSSGGVRGGNQPKQISVRCGDVLKSFAWSAKKPELGPKPSWSFTWPTCAERRGQALLLAMGRTAASFCKVSPHRRRGGMPSNTLVSRQQGHGKGQPGFPHIQ